MRTYRMQPYLQSGGHAQVAVAPALRPCVSIKQGHQLGNTLVTDSKRFPHRDIGLLGDVIVQRTAYCQRALHHTISELIRLHIHSARCHPIASQ